MYTRLACLFFLVLFPFGAMAQEDLSGELVVNVKSPGDLYLDGALVAVVETPSTFRIPKLPMGTHELSLKGARATTRKEVYVGSNDTVTVTLSLPETDQPPPPDEPPTARPDPVPLDCPEWARPWTVATLGVVLLPIEPGTFQMGSPAWEWGREPDETLHTVTLTRPFWMARYQVTLADYQRYLLATGNTTGIRLEGAEAPFHDKPGYPLGGGRFSNDPRQPVNQVSRRAALAFCQWLNEQEFGGQTVRGCETLAGYQYRLPTEAEWEYACRAGTDTAFIWGTSFELGRCNTENGRQYGATRNMAGFAKRGIPTDRTVPVGLFEPNAWGLYDMIGNLHEMCIDRNGPYPEGDVTDPLNTSGDSYAIRGGAWDTAARYSRSADRYRTSNDNCSIVVGFRFVLAPAVSAAD